MDISASAPLQNGSSQTIQFLVLYLLSFLADVFSFRFALRLTAFETDKYIDSNYCNAVHSKNQNANTMVIDDRCGTMGKSAADFVGLLLTLNPDNRPSISSVLQHEWLRDVYKRGDYHKCPPFDGKFEIDPMLKTQFGMRHQMVVEMQRIHDWAKMHSPLYRQ